jgi:hypothetical protein
LGAKNVAGLGNSTRAYDCDGGTEDGAPGLIDNDAMKLPGFRFGQMNIVASGVGGRRKVVRRLKVQWRELRRTAVLDDPLAGAPRQHRDNRRKREQPGNSESSTLAGGGHCCARCLERRLQLQNSGSQEQCSDRPDGDACCY